MSEYGGNIGNMNVKGTMNVVPLALVTQLMDRKINSIVYVLMIDGSMNTAACFWLGD